MTSSLILAAERGDAQRCRELVALGHDVGKKYVNGVTCIDVAKANGHYELACELAKLAGLPEPKRPLCVIQAEGDGKLRLVLSPTREDKAPSQS